MSKLSIEHSGNQTVIKCKLDWTEQIRRDEVKKFDEKIIRGLMKPVPNGNRKFDYFVPSGIALQSYLKNGLSKEDFFMVFVQIIEMIKKVKTNGLMIDNLKLDLQYTFINEKTKEVYFVYIPLQEQRHKLNITAFMCDMAYMAVFDLNADTRFINDLVDYLGGLETFSITAIEEYVLKEYPEIYKKVNRQEYVEDGPKQRDLKEIVDNSFVNEKKVLPSNDRSGSIGIEKEPDVKSPNPFSEENTFIPDEEDTLITGEEDTVILDDDLEEGTIVLDTDDENEETNNDKAFLIRIRTSERIDVTKDIFTIGKDATRVDYAILDNGAISRVHAEININAGKYYLKDNHSTNGSYINNEIINRDEFTELSHGDEIMLADERFEFNVENNNK